MSEYDEDERREERDKVDMQRALDAAFAFIGETMPPLWRRLYDNCVLAGFTKEESFVLVKVYILAQCNAGIRGTDK